MEDPGTGPYKTRMIPFLWCPEIPDIEFIVIQGGAGLRPNPFFDREFLLRCQESGDCLNG